MFAEGNLLRGMSAQSFPNPPTLGSIKVILFVFFIAVITVRTYLYFCLPPPKMCSEKTEILSLFLVLYSLAPRPVYCHIVNAQFTIS